MWRLLDEVERAMKRTVLIGIVWVFGAAAIGNSGIQSAEVGLALVIAWTIGVWIWAKGRGG